MKRFFLLIACVFSILFPATVYAANVTKVVITAIEPVVGEVRSFKASVPGTASTEIYEVHWSGEFENGKFVQGRDYTMTVKLRIKASSSNIFATSSKINATINGHKARITNTSQKNITVRYTWKKLGGENPNDPKYKLKTKLKELAAAYTATNASDDKELLKYLKEKLPKAEIWSTGVSYKYTRKIPSETKDGNISVPIGITYDGITLNSYNFTVILPALNKSPESTKLNADMAIMKTALKNLMVNARTTGDDVLAAVNSAAVHGTKAVWDVNYKYNAPSANFQGSIDGNLILTLGDKKDIFHAHKTLPIAGDSADAAIDADFSALSKALHNYAVKNSTTAEQLIDIAKTSLKNGSKLTFVNFTKKDATYNNEGKIIICFDLENNGKTRNPRIELRWAKVRVPLPEKIDINQDEWEVLRLTNIERYKKNCELLVIVAPLQDAADIRAKEIKTDYRLDHKRPDGSSCFTAIDPNFRKHRRLGENAAQSQVKPSQVMNSWMNSPGHRANILTPHFCYFGTGVTGEYNYKYWIQMFSDGSGVIDAETNTGSLNFDTLTELEMAYLICTTGEGLKAYVPLDTDYMVKNGNQYTIHLRGKSVTVTVGSNSD